MMDVDLPPGAQPVDGAMQSEFVAPLAEAAGVAFREVAGSEIFLQTAFRISTPVDFGDRSALIELTFPSGPGALVLSVTDTAAQALASRVLAGQELTLDGPLVDDCLGEISNVIAGQGKAMLWGTDRHYTFGTPRVASGPGRAALFGSRLNWIVLRFQSDLGLISLQITEVTSAK